MGRLANKIGSGIGLVSEAIASRKSSKPSDSVSPKPAKETTRVPLSPYAEVPDNYRDSSERPPTRHGLDTEANGTEEKVENGGKLKELSLQDAEKDTAPDDDDASSSEAEETAPKKSSNEMAGVFLKQHPPPSHALDSPPGQLPCPVIVPQRRPGDQKRGFMMAYAPVLGDCGIDQATFLEFLHTFQSSCQAHSALRVVNVSAIGVGFVPGPISKGVSAAIRISVGVAMEAQRRSKTTSFLDRMNQEFFQPRNLYCLIMTYKPDSPSANEIVGGVRGDESQAFKPVAAPSTVRQKFASFQKSSGTTHGELELPEAAPLVFPNPDDDDASTSNEAHKKANGFHGTTNFTRDYLDRRERAKYAGNNTDSKLATNFDQPFKTRYGDPNSAANSGSLSALLTGGALDLKRRRLERRNKGREMMGLEPKDNNHERQGPVRKVFKKDILYLMVVNLPSEAELRKAVKEANLP